MITTDPCADGARRRTPGSRAAARLGDLARLPAHAAEPVSAVPVEQRRRVGDQPALVLGQRAARSRAPTRARRAPRRRPRTAPARPARPAAAARPARRAGPARAVPVRPAPPPARTTARLAGSAAARPPIGSRRRAVTRSSRAPSNVLGVATDLHGSLPRCPAGPPSRPSRCRPAASCTCPAAASVPARLRRRRPAGPAPARLDVLGRPQLVLTYAALAEAGYRVLAVDHRGHGRGLRSPSRSRSRTAPTTPRR